MIRRRNSQAFALTLLLAACTPPASDSADPKLAIAWVRDAAEFRALSRQVYSMASRALPEMIADTSWSALPEQTDAASLPPAIILDVDETALTNAKFQAALVPPFRDNKLTEWSNEHQAEALPGALDFVNQAVAAGVRPFFLTNRPCEANGRSDCPQKAIVINDLVEAGFPADESNVSLAYEQPGWSKEKSIRRRYIATDHRVIMLFGDDLGDFIPCTRKRVLEPCRNGATRDSRWQQVGEYAHFWGNGWYVLPNPMHGSWTSMD